MIWAVTAIFMLVGHAYANPELEAVKKMIAESQDTSNVNGYKVDIKEVETDGYREEALIIDGKEILRGYRLHLDSKQTVGKDTVVLGWQYNEGNSCEGSSFLVVVNKDEAPKLFGPIETCIITLFELGENSVTFETPHNPGLTQEKWRWTADKGIVSLGEQELPPSDQSGWGALTGKTIDTPWETFNNVEINDQIKSLLGNDYKQYRQIISGVGSGTYKNGNYLGSSCTPHMCSEQEAIIYLDRKSKKVFAAFKMEGQKIKVFPSVKSWPKGARQELSKWSKKFN